MNEADNLSSTRFQKGSMWLPVLGLGTLMAGGAAVYEYKQTNSLQQQVKEARSATNSVEALTHDSDLRWQKAISSLREDLNLSREQTSRNVALASRRTEQVARNQTKKISEELNKVRETAQATSTAVQGISSEVGAVKSDVGSVRSDVTTVRSDVTTVRTDVDAVKTEVATAQTAINETRTALQRARGDLGEMSGLIATNSSQIGELRALGDRNIYEFTLARGTMQKVGDIQVELKKADKAHNRFTLDVLANDKRVEKKNRSINEPVQFYTTGARQPYEMVINQVLKDKVVGYLATPKVALSRIQPR